VILQKQGDAMANHNTDLELLQSIINYKFHDISLLKNALTHSSYANEVKKRNLPDNERLEFLGDAVLELSSSDYIYKTYNLAEGDMTRMRASIVCEPTLALCARQFRLPEFIMLGKGEDMTGGRKRDSIVSDACEALIGAIYLDGGFANAKEFVNNFILNDLENKQLFFDSKTILQEIVQARGKEVTYELIGEEGPEHDKKFFVRAYCDDLFSMTAEGHTKKHAQQQAAYNALIYLKEKGINLNLKGKN
jgi:ribonuclease-3